MHFSIGAALVSASLVCSVAAGPVRERAAGLQKRDNIVTPKAICAGPGGPVPDPEDAAPRRVVIDDPDVAPGSKRIKLRYGPYMAPGMTKKSITGENGMLWNCADGNIEKPCEECVITRLVAGMEYPDGRNANIDTGMWMHHMVAINAGPGRWDSTCRKDNFSMPHLVVGVDSTNSERFFASGNERTVIDARIPTIRGQKLGYAIRPADKFKFIVDLMNMNQDDRIMYLTMTYDVIDGKLPEGFLDTKPIWLDVDQCNLSEANPDPKKAVQSIIAEPWVPDFDGDIIGTGGHLHDGGVNLDIYHSPDQLACNSFAKYAESKEFVYTGAMSMAGMDDVVPPNHISSMHTCWAKDMDYLKLNTSQSWVIKGNYNYTKHAGMVENGEPADIMAIALLYAAVPREGVTPPGLVPMPLPVETPGVDNPGRLATALDKINDGMKELTSALDGFNGDVVAATGILTIHEKFIKNLEATNEYVQSFKAEPVETVRMLGTVAGLLQNTRDLVKVLISKEPAFDAAGLKFIVLDNIQSAMKAATTLTKTMATVSPPKAKRVVDVVVDQINDSVGQALKVFGSADDIAATTPVDTTAAPAPAADAMAGMAGMAGMNM